MRMLSMLTGLLFLGVLLLPSQARALFDMREQRVPHVIETVELLPPLHPDLPLLMRVSGYQPDGCELPVIIEQTVTEDHLRVEIYRMLPPDMICSQQIVPFDEIIELSGDEVHILLNPIVEGDSVEILRSPSEWQAVIEVNNFVGILLGEGIVPAERVPLHVMSVELYTRDDDNLEVQDADTPISDEDTVDLADVRIGLLVEGTHPDGCREPFYSHLMVSGNTLNVEIHRVQLPDTVRICPAVIREFRAIIDLGDVPPGDYLYNVNGVTGTVMMPNGRSQEANGNRIPHVINSVDVLLLESFPVQAQLEVSGYQTDGCETEVLVDVSQRGRDVQVEIYRVLPPFVMCTMVIVDYEETISLGAFDPGQYRVTVNGVTTAFRVD